MAIETAVISRTGGRSKNEDARGYLLLDEGGCWVVADGLGGHRGGEAASRIATETILGSFKGNPALTPQALHAHIEAANQAILEKQKREAAYGAARTTVVVLVSDYHSWGWAHAGDSRLYWFRGGRLVFQTRDHSVPQAMADAGDITPDQIRNHEDRNRLLKVLGNEGKVRPTVHRQKYPVQGGDAFLLCVDGFWEYLYETEMAVDLVKSAGPEAWLERMELRLLERAPQNNDNYTAIAVTCDLNS